MNLKKTHELYFENNDVYQIESCLDKIIVNEDYHGIRILDLSLNTIKIIPLMDRLVTYTICKKYDQSAVMIYAPEQNRLIFIDLQTFKHFSVTPDLHLMEYPFDRNYYWQDNIFIFALENTDIFYQIDFESFNVKKISHKTVKTLAPDFLDFWKICKKYKAETIYPDQYSFTFKKNRKLIAFYDYKNKTLIFQKHKLGLFDEPHYYNGTFIFFDSWYKNITQKNNRMFLPQADPSYYYLRIKNLSNGNIVVLLTNKDDHQYCALKVYEVLK